MNIRRLFASVVLAAALFLLLIGCSEATPTAAESRTGISVEAADETISQLYENRQSDVQVQGKGIVSRIIKDDTEGSRHQRFILELNSGQSLLVAHNVDVAPRLEGLEVGDTVEFYGEYYYNEEGGGIHWTHRDSDGHHEDGWLLWNGTYYE